MEKYVERNASKVNSRTLIGFWYCDVPNRKTPIWGFADICPELLLIKKGEVQIHDADNTLLAKSNKAIILGGMDHPFYMKCSKNTSVVGLFLQPQSLNCLLKLNPSVLFNKALNLTHTTSKHISSLLDLAGRNDAFKLIDDYFKNNFTNSNHCELMRLLNAMIIEGYSTSRHHQIKNIAYSERHLRRIIKENTGLPPNKFFRLCKIKGVIKNISQFKSLTDLTYRFDYFDQSHFIKDFRKYTGQPPKMILNPLMHEGFEWLERHKIG